MIQTVHFENFKAWRTLDLKPSPTRLTVLVGPNGSGKTSVLEGIDAVSSVVDSTDTLGSLPTTWRSQRASEAGNDIVTVKLQTQGFGANWTGAKINLSGTNRNDSDWKCMGRVWIPDKSTSEQEWRDVRILGPEDVRKLRAAFGSCRLLRLDPRSLVRPSTSSQEIPRLGDDGTGLFTVLKYLKLKTPERYAAIVAGLRQVVPSARDMEWDQVMVDVDEERPISVGGVTTLVHDRRRLAADTFYFHTVSGDRIEAANVSEGTLLALGILTVLNEPTRPRIVLWDDMDRALHPTAQRDLIKQIRILLDENPELQIVATSHSPYLLDELKPEEIRITNLDDDGSAVCARLDSHPEFDRWKGLMMPGEFWSMVGEEWITKTPAASPAAE